MNPILLYQKLPFNSDADFDFMCGARGGLKVSLAGKS
jgi:hypothetical protein